jgi:4-hydroxybenzoate polyprenyltransferase
VIVWLRLIKFRYHLTFATVVFGALLFAREIDWRLALRLIALYGCFNVLLYGGIYTLNDVADRGCDARHPRKALRPVASGRVSARAAVVLGAALIACGLGLAHVLFDEAVVSCFGAVLVFNGLYSIGGRNLRYLDLLLNSVTHPTRFLMGTLLVGRIPPVTHLVALFALAIAMSCLRRAIERDVAGADARVTIGRYAPQELPSLSTACLLALTVMALAFSADAPGFYVIVGLTSAILGVGGWLSRPMRAGLREIWTH